jgi:hypothetical protein
MRLLNIRHDHLLKTWNLNTSLNLKKSCAVPAILNKKLYSSSSSNDPDPTLKVRLSFKLLVSNM